MIQALFISASFIHWYECSEILNLMLDGPGPGKEKVSLVYVHFGVQHVSIL